MSDTPRLDGPSLSDLDLHSPQRQLIEWQIEHADLDALIDQASAVAAKQDDLSLRRMKKRRLALRDQIAALQSRLAPKEPA
jgi:hypothetical protein